MIEELLSSIEGFATHTAIQEGPITSECYVATMFSFSGDAGLPEAFGNTRVFACEGSSKDVFIYLQEVFPKGAIAQEGFP